MGEGAVDLQACYPQQHRNRNCAGWLEWLAESERGGARLRSNAMVIDFEARFGFNVPNLANQYMPLLREISTLPRAEALAAQFGANVHPIGWNAVNEVLPGAKLLVNTTSLGMHGQPPLDVDIARLPEAAVVADLVYVPLVTPLLAAAKARGLKTADGLGMLLHQAVRGFELWFGRRPEVTAELRALVEADLTKS